MDMMMKTTFISLIILLLALTAKGFNRLLPQKRATVVRPFTLLPELCSARAQEEVHGGGGNSNRKIDRRDDDDDDETERRLIEDLQNQQCEHTYWMSQKPYKTKDTTKTSGPGDNESPLDLRIQEMEEDVDHWKDRFHEMRFKWVRENGRRRKQVKELQDKLKRSQDQAETEKSSLKRQLAVRDIQWCSVMAELGRSREQLEEAQEVIKKNEEHIVELKENQRSLWALSKTGLRLIRSGIVTKTRRLLRRPTKD